MTPKLFYYGCAMPSQSFQKATLKNRVREFCTSRFFFVFSFFLLLFSFSQNEDFDNLRTQKFEVNKTKYKENVW